MINKLPIELLWTIYRDLAFVELFRLSKVCKTQRNTVLSFSFKNVTLIVGDAEFKPVMKKGSRNKGICINKNSVTHFAEKLGQVSSLNSTGYFILDSLAGRTLAPYLIGLTKLNMSRVDIQEPVVKVFLETCKRLTHLDVSYCQQLTCNTILYAAKYSSQLEYIDISYTACASNNALSLLSAVFPYLRHLAMSGCSNVNWSIASCLFPSSLKKLVLNRNYLLTDECLIEIVSERLKRSTTHLELFVMDCDDLTGSNIDKLQSSDISIHGNPKLWDDTPDSIRLYLDTYHAIQT
jgi:hypothetical protein